MSNTTNVGVRIQMSKKHQVKSRWYYIFWGIATVAVVAGQIYVGTGYRQMSESVNEVVSKLK